MATAEAAHVAEERPEVQEDRWPLLPDNNLYRSGARPMETISQILYATDACRRTIIATTTDVEHLRNIIERELLHEYPRSDVIAMCNQQIDRVRNKGLDKSEEDGC